jgi:hypothetical protein
LPLEVQDSVAVADMHELHYEVAPTKLSRRCSWLAGTLRQIGS